MHMPNTLTSQIHNILVFILVHLAVIHGKGHHLLWKHLHQTVPSAAHNPLAVLTSDNGANALTAHNLIAYNLLRIQLFL
jgi:hypothetical protein